MITLLFLSLKIIAQSGNGRNEINISASKLEGQEEKWLQTFNLEGFEFLRKLVFFFNIYIRATETTARIRIRFLLRDKKIRQISKWSGGVISLCLHFIVAFSDLWRVSLWSDVWVTPRRLSPPCAEIPSSFPAAANNNDYSGASPHYLCYCCGVSDTWPWSLPRYQQEYTNTNTFAWVIDLYLPTFLTAFSSYWQHKHIGWRITFHLRSARSSSFRPPPYSLPCLISPSAGVSPCSYNLFK